MSTDLLDNNWMTVGEVIQSCHWVMNDESTHTICGLPAKEHEYTDTLPVTCPICVFMTGGQT